MGSFGSGDLVIDFPALPERVWEAMVNPAKAAGWMYDDASATVGDRFALPAGTDRVVIFRVIDVQAPSRVTFEGRLTTRSGSHVDSPAITMAWNVSPAPRGSAVRVQVTPTQGVAPETVEALRVLFNDRLRSTLRTRAALGFVAGPAPDPLPARTPGPAVPDPLPAPTPDPAVPDPLPARTGPAVPGPRDPGAAPIVGLAGDAAAPMPSSEAIASFPPVRTAGRGPESGDGTRDRRGRRLLGLALPVWLVAAALCAVGGLGAVVLYPRFLPWGDDPGESTLDDPGAGTGSGVGVIGSGSARPGSSPSGTAGASASADPSASVSGSPAPPGALQVALANQQILGLGGVSLLGYRVTITITNTDDAAQQWTNVSFQVPAGGLTLTAGSGVAAQAQDTTICVTPTGPQDGPPRTVPPDGGSVTVQVEVTRLVYTGDPPHSVALADADCAA